jgi:hypothetical protein
VLTVLRRAPADREVSISVRLLLFLQVDIKIGREPE